MLNKIKADNLTARKARDKFTSGILTTLIGEISIIGKNDGNRETTEPEAIKVITKFAKGVKETIEMITDGNDFNHLNAVTMEKVNTLDKELKLYETYLPQLMSEDKLRKIITDLNLNNIGAIMGALNKSYKGKFDGSMASKLAKELL